jgi:hypothetical protein
MAKTPYHDIDPALLQGREYLETPWLDLEETPQGQGFLIGVAGQRESIFGIVADPELPIAIMRPNFVGAVPRRYLQAIGNREVDMVLSERYYRFTRGGGEAVFTPESLVIGNTVHFMEIDANGEAVMPKGNTIVVDSFRVASIQSTTPLVEAPSLPTAA